MEISLDWVAGTYKQAELEEVKAWWGRFVDGWTLLRGQNGYKQSWRGRGVSIHFDGTANMGIHVECSGEGVRWLNACDEFPGWPRAFVLLAVQGWKGTRLDLAFDDKEGIVTVEACRRSLEVGTYTSKWKEWSDRRSVAKGGRTGDVLYLGAASSDCCLCIYDKRLEQAQKGVRIDTPWVRLELRFKAGQAAVLARVIGVRGDIAWCEGLLRGVVDFKRSVGDVNMARRQSERWWLDFMGGTVAVKLALPDESGDLMERLNQFAKQHGATMAMLQTAFESMYSNFDVFGQMIEEGRSRLKDKHVNWISEQIQSRQGEASEGFLQEDEVEL